MVESLDDALQITGAVAVGVAEGTHVQLVDDGVAPPFPLRHCPVSVPSFFVVQSVVVSHTYPIDVIVDACARHLDARGP